MMTLITDIVSFAEKFSIIFKAAQEFKKNMKRPFGDGVDCGRSSITLSSSRGIAVLLRSFCGAMVTYL
jgi:hypothetical protein